MLKGHDGLIYVPSSITGKIQVFSLQPDDTLMPVHTISLEAPLDNLSIDSKGDIYATTFPKMLEFLKHHKNPYGVHPPTAVWRIRKTNEGNGEMRKGMQFETKKVLEGSGEHLPSATIAVHDPKTGRIFLGGELH